MTADKLCILLALICLSFVPTGAEKAKKAKTVTCDYNGKRYQPGEVVYDDPCQHSECSETGEIVSYYSPCPEVCDPKYPQPACCPPCQEPTTLPPPPPEPIRGCTYNGKFYSPGPIDTGNPCSGCDCPEEGGEAMCWIMDCANWFDCPDGQVLYRKPGDCCASCVPYCQC